MKIYKYLPDRHFEFSIPRDSKILDIQFQNGQFVLWALINSVSKDTDKKVIFYFTSKIVHNNTIYIKTLITQNELAYHFFEMIP